MAHRPLIVVLALIGAAALAGCAATPPSVSGGACLAALDRHQIAYRPVVAGDPRDGRCIVDTAVRVSRIEVALNHPATMSCALADRLDAFERDVVQPLAHSDLGRRVAGIDHLGSYACRDNTSMHGRLSEHAFGRAIDIAGFRLADGTIVSVERDWAPPGPKRNFLRDVAYNSCRYFSVVLTPNSNRDHYNHFHLDIGPDRVCSI